MMSTYDVELKSGVGSVVEADYSPSCLPIYRGNPMIEALPDLMDYKTKSIISMLQAIPKEPVSSARRSRYGWLMSLNVRLFIPFARHIRLQELIDVMIRQGYLQRNPMSHKHNEYLQDAYRRQQAGEKLLVTYGAPQPDPLSLAIVGCSGAGKSYAVSRILQLYPQVIEHTERNIGINFMQVVYLKVECPHEGSIKSLCVNIISELDRVTGQSYAQTYNKRVTLEQLKQRLVHLLAIHKVGILVIDEIQNLVLSRKNRDELFNFIVSLANSLCVPLLFIGTPKIQKFMQKDLRIARRFGTCGVLQWNRFDTQTEAGKSEWDEFMARLWQCNVLKNSESSIPKEISEAFYTYSQGIVDIAIKLFILSQMHALYVGEEALTKGIIEEAFDDYCRNIKPMIDGIRSGNPRVLEQYEDITMRNEDYDYAVSMLGKKIEQATTEVNEFEPQDAANKNRVIKNLSTLNNANIAMLKKILESIREDDPTKDPNAELMEMLEGLVQQKSVKKNLPSQQRQDTDVHIDTLS